MAEVIPDGAVETVLRVFVRATRPVLDGLREVDPFGLRTRVPSTGEHRSIGTRLLDLLATVEVPGTPAWAAMDVTGRSRWWVRRVGRFTTLLAAVPGIGGALANRFPVSKALGAAGQGLLLVAIAGEHGVHDEGEIVALLGTVLFRRHLAVATPDAATDAAATAKAKELTGDLHGEAKPGLQRLAAAVWRLGRALFAFEGELDRRPHGNAVQRFLGELPLVGVLGKYLGEWSGLKKAAKQAEALLPAPGSGSGGAR